MEKLEDKELVILLKSGSKQAFDVIYRRHHAVLYLFARRLIKDDDTAADLVQEVFVKLWEHSSILPFDINIKSYLYSMIRNRVLNYIRNNRSRMMNNYKIVQDMTLDCEDEILNLMEDKDMTHRFDKAVQSLPSQQRRVILLKLKGKTSKEIARMMELSLNTVNAHYRLGLKALKNKLLILMLMLFIW